MWLHNFMHRKVSCNIYLDFRHLFPVLPVVMESVKMRHMWEVTSGFVYISCKISTSKCSQFEKILPQFKIIQIQRCELKNIQVTSSGKFVLYLSFLFPLNGYGVSVRPVQMRKLLFLPVYCMYNHESPFSEYTESMTGQGLSAFFLAFSLEMTTWHSYTWTVWSFVYFRASVVSVFLLFSVVGVLLSRIGFPLPLWMH